MVQWSGDTSDEDATGDGGGRGRRVGTGRTIGPMSTRARRQGDTPGHRARCFLEGDFSFHDGDGISAGGDTGGASRAGCVVRHGRPLSSRVARRWRRFFGTRARRRPTGLGASASEPRWPPHGGRRGRLRGRGARVGLRLAGEGPLADPRRGPLSKPSWFVVFIAANGHGGASVSEAGAAHLGEGAPGSLGVVRVVAVDGESSSGSASLCGVDRDLAPVRSDPWHPLRVRACVDRGGIRCELAGQRGSHGGGNIGVPRRRVASRCGPFPVIGRRGGHPEGALASDHSVRRVDPPAGLRAEHSISGATRGEGAEPTLRCSWRVVAW